MRTDQSIRRLPAGAAWPECARTYRGHVDKLGQVQAVRPPALLEVGGRVHEQMRQDRPRRRIH
jgi:hypothetical protein